MELRPVMRYREASYKCPYVYYARCRQVGLYEAVERVFVDASKSTHASPSFTVFDVPRV
jgi:hypothetical protein